MNERIKQLAEQATDDILGVKVLDKDRFARLIVEECIEVVGKNTASPNGVRALMKHFGVE